MRRTASFLCCCVVLGVLGLVTPAWAPFQPPNVYVFHCGQGPPFGSTSNETAMTTVFGPEGDGWRKVCLESVVTGPDRQFSNPNGTTPDPVNGFGGAGGGLIIGETSITFAGPAATPPGRFSDALTVVVE